MTYTFTGVPIDTIVIGERRRTDMGDLGALARGIERVGLLSPIVIDRNGSDSYRLVAGERRLRAVQLLGWKAIPAQLRSELTEAELRDIELEENENRKELTLDERSKVMTFADSKKVVEDAKRAAEIIGAAPIKSEAPRGRGRPVKADSKTAVAEALGASPRTVERAEQHVETATEFPFMQDEAWRQSDVLRVRERLQEFPEQERDQAGGVLACAQVLHPKTAVDLLDKLKAQPAAQRQEIYELSRSEDSRDTSLALTRAAELPPMPDPRREILRGAIAEVKKAAKLYPDDPLAPRIAAAAAELTDIRKAIGAPQE